MISFLLNLNRCPQNYFLINLIFLLSISLYAHAQTEERRTISAQQIKGSQINIDGKLTEDIWEKTSYATDFIQREPNEGAEATEQTKVAFAYDDKALYIGARMYSPKPKKIQAQLSRRDNTGNAERLVVSLDAYLDRRTARSFVITASSVRADYTQPEDEMNFRSRDYSFDPVWTAKSHIDSLGWTAEMRVPFSQLRYSEKKNQVWGLNINRFLPHKNEDVYWVMIPQDETGWASRFGYLKGISEIPNVQQIELIPYLAGNMFLDGNPNPQDPFNDKYNMEGRIGGDFKIGLGSNLKLDGTINPDFGQVEADPAQVNLSAFETFFEEKRPFFTENQQLFSVLGGGGRSDRYFYSRRIGAAPSLRPSGDDIDFVDQTDNTSILGASKLSGRFPSGLSVGGIAAVTAREDAEVYNVDTDTFNEVKVEPLTGYGVVRLQQEIGENASTAGVVLTGVSRNLEEGTELAKMLNRSALTGGSDWNIRFQEGKYVLSGDAGFSYISGEPEAIMRTQRSSARYLQRPDASHLDIDSTKTSLSGYRGKLEFSKNSGEHWLWEIETSTKSPGFDLNDVGILFTTDEITTGAEITYRENTPSSWYQSYRFELSGSSNWNYGGTLREREIELSTRIQWKNFWFNFLNIEYSPRTFDDRLTRGGPLMGSPTSYGLRTGIFTNRSANVFGQAFISYDSDEFGGWELGMRPSVEVRTGGKWELQLSPRFSRETSTRQYITTLSGGRSETFGKRYIFSNIDRTTLSLQTRLNYAFTPDLTIEMYAEPFVASGNYYKPGELPSPRSYQLDHYDVLGKNSNDDFLVSDGSSQFTVPDNDFLVKSFRSSIVLRYQWRPGSTFFLVWQQNRFARTQENRFVELGDLVNALGETGDNLFAIKFTYWFSAN
ncbi:DUF5916 domain-containing protein [Fodinibius sp.]|uniref:DUF5916 domain-containing protein n=1 Tax=Fodinibius sp. TaxID=1872440 RepID=UPI002ACD209F|nr:DUF5916 domain-containing protein [Fodinibius sp.]MDZ7659064.1 DUF5916 domain-containing protein [Fodinibius sp.]